MILHYYLPKAYDFICKLLALPQPCSIKALTASVACNPCYLTDASKVIGSLVEKKSWMSDAVLIVDAMALQSNIAGLHM